MLANPFRVLREAIHEVPVVGYALGIAGIAAAAAIVRSFLGGFVPGVVAVSGTLVLMVVLIVLAWVAKLVGPTIKVIAYVFLLLMLLAFFVPLGLAISSLFFCEPLPLCKYVQPASPNVPKLGEDRGEGSNTRGTSIDSSRPSQGERDAAVLRVIPVVRRMTTDTIPSGVFEYAGQAEACEGLAFSPPLTPLRVDTPFHVMNPKLYCDDSSCGGGAFIGLAGDTTIEVEPPCEIPWRVKAARFKVSKRVVAETLSPVSLSPGHSVTVARPIQALKFFLVIQSRWGEALWDPESAALASPASVRRLSRLQRDDSVVYSISR